MDDDEREALRAEGLDPNNPAVQVLALTFRAEALTTAVASAGIPLASAPMRFQSPIGFFQPTNHDGADDGYESEVPPRWVAP